MSKVDFCKKVWGPEELLCVKIINILHSTVTKKQKNKQSNYLNFEALTRLIAISRWAWFMNHLENSPTQLGMILSASLRLCIKITNHLVESINLLAVLVVIL